MKFDMGRAWGDATRLLSANITVISIVAAVFFFLPYLVMNLQLSNVMGQLLAAGPLSAGQLGPEAALGQITAIYAQLWWVLLLVIVGQTIGMLGLLALLTDRQRPTVGEALVFGILAFFPYLGAIVLLYLLMLVVLGIPMGVAVYSGSNAAVAIVGLAALVAFVYAAVKFSLVPAVIATERVLNPFKALVRSWRLTKGNSVRIFLFYLLLIIVLVVVALVVSFVVGLIVALLGPAGALWGNGVLSSVVNSAWVVLFVAILASVHHQLAGPSDAGLAETFG